MGTGRTDEFRKDAVRIALSSKDQEMIRGIIFPEDGLTRRQVADDLGVGLSTLTKWVTAHRDTDVVSAEDRELARENERLRRENRILKEERDILKKGETIFRHWSEDNGRTSSSRAKSREVQVCRRTARGFPGRSAVPGDGRQPARVAGLSQPSGQSQAAHRHGRSGPYQGPIAPEPGQLWPPEDDRRTEGNRRRCGAPPCRARSTGKRSPGTFSKAVSKLSQSCLKAVSLREHGIVVERTRKFKATTDSDHTFNIAPNLLDRDFTADRPNQKWAGDISYIWTREGWLYLALAVASGARTGGATTGNSSDQWRTMARSSICMPGG